MTTSLQTGRDALVLASMKLDEIKEALGTLRAFISIAQENLGEHYPGIDELDNDLETMGLPVESMLRKADKAHARIQSVREVMRGVQA